MILRGWGPITKPKQTEVHKYMYVCYSCTIGKWWNNFLMDCDQPSFKCRIRISFNSIHVYLFKQNDHNSNFTRVSSKEHDIMQLKRSWEESSTYSIQSSSFWKSRSRAAIFFHFGLLVTIEYPWWNSSMYLECKQGCLWDTNNFVEYYSSRKMKNWRVSALWLLTCNNLDEVFGIKLCLTLYMNARIILFPCFLSLTLPAA